MIKCSIIKSTILTDSFFIKKEKQPKLYRKIFFQRKKEIPVFCFRSLASSGKKKSSRGRKNKVIFALNQTVLDPVLVFFFFFFFWISRLVELLTFNPYKKKIIRSWEYFTEQKKKEEFLFFALGFFEPWLLTLHQNTFIVHTFFFCKKKFWHVEQHTHNDGYKYA